MNKLQKILEGKDDEDSMLAYTFTGKNLYLGTVINHAKNVLSRYIEDHKIDGIDEQNLEHALHYLFAYVDRGGMIKIYKDRPNQNPNKSKEK